MSSAKYSLYVCVYELRELQRKSPITLTTSGNLRTQMKSYFTNFVFVVADASVVYTVPYADSVIGE